MESTTRDEEVAQLHNYQEKDLSQLQKQLESLDAQIAASEENVAHMTNLLSAARGVVGMRGGTVNYAQGEARKAGARSRPKQRVWTQKDGNITLHDKEFREEPWSETQPCGMIYTAFQKRFEAPRQSFTGNAGRATILITERDDKWESLFKELEPGSRLWILYWLDRNSDHWRHFVRPPRAKGGWRVGLFATRSPNRPSPIGLSLSVVEDIDHHGRKILVSGVDILDETPLLALKHYDMQTESHPDAKSGWLDEEDKLQPLYYDDLHCEQNEEQWTVSINEEALEQLQFIDERSSVNIVNLVQESLKRVHLRNNELKVSPESELDVQQILAVGAFRVAYKTVTACNDVVVTSVESGMRREVCLEESACDPEARLHLEFQEMYQSESSKTP